jgi:hypothetical protein
MLHLFLVSNTAEQGRLQVAKIAYPAVLANTTIRQKFDESG